MMAQATDIAKQNSRSQSAFVPASRAPFRELPLHPMLQVQRQAGNQAILGLLRSGGIRPKLKVGGAEDPEEKAADEVADRVMRKPAGGFGGGACTCSPGGEMCEQCQSVLRSARGTAGAVDAPPVVQQTLATSGRPLAPSTRSDMEARFGWDFGDVRIHTDDSAAESAEAIKAQAYTTGSHIVFGQGQYAPRSDAGGRLLAHELAHVVQQATGAARSVRPQLFTPLGAGGGFGGLLERDRQAAMAPHPDDRAKKIADAIDGGWRDVRDLDEITLSVADAGQRQTMLGQLAQAWWTGGREEEAIIRIIRTTPLGQAADLVNRLENGKIDGDFALDELDSVVNGSNNLEMHAELSGLRLKAMGPEKGSKALQEAPILPWNDVMGFFEDDATFFVSETDTHQIRIKYPTAVLYSTDFASEVKKLPFDMFIHGQDYDPAQVFIVHDYGTGRFVPVVAKELIGYQNAGIRGFLGHVGTVASFGLPVSAAESAIAKAAVFVLERALPALFLLIDENRLNLVKWFPKWGPQMIYYADLAKVGVGIYGIGRFAVSGYQIFQSWRSVRQARQAMEGLSGEASAEQAAAAIEKQADETFAEVDKIRGGEPQVGPAKPATTDAPGAKTRPSETDLSPPPEKGPTGPHPDGAQALEEESKILRQKVHDPETIRDVLNPELREKYDFEINVGEHTYYHQPNGIWCRASGVAFCGYSFGREIEEAIAEARQVRRPSLSGKETEAVVQDFLGRQFRGQVGFLGGRQITGTKFGMSIADFARGGRRLRVAEVKNINIESNIATGFADLRDQVGKYLVNVPEPERAELLLFLDIRGQRISAGGFERIVRSCTNRDRRCLQSCVPDYGTWTSGLLMLKGHYRGSQMWQDQQAHAFRARSYKAALERLLGVPAGGYRICLPMMTAQLVIIVRLGHYASHSFFGTLWTASAASACGVAFAVGAPLRPGA